MTRLSIRHLALAALLGLAGACGSEDPDPALGIVGDTGPLVMGLSRQFTAELTSVPGDSVVWELPDGPGTGTIDQTGLFTAGLTPGSWRIVATAVDDPTATDTIHVSVVAYTSTTSLGLPTYGVAVASTGVIGSADNNTFVRFRDGASTTTVNTGSLPVHLAFAPGGATAFVTSMGGKLFRINVAAGIAVDTADFGRSVYNIAIRSTDSLVYVTTVDGWLLKVAPATLTALDSVHLASASNGIAFGPGGATLWASTIAAGVLYRIDPATLAKIDSIPLGTGLQRLAVAPSGDSVYVADQSAGGIHVLRVSTGAVSFLALPYTPHGVGISSDGSKLFVAQVFGGRVSVLDRASLQLLGVVPVGGWPRNVAAIPGGGAMVVSTESDLLRLN